MNRARNLVLIFGDQLTKDSTALTDFDKKRDAVLMMEVIEEASYVPQHKIRIALFFSAMRHFAAQLERRGYRVHYSELEDVENRGSFAREIPRWLRKTHARQLVAALPGDYRVLDTLRSVARKAGVDLDIRPDRHFIDGPDEFESFAQDRKHLLLETYYREMRRRHGILMQDGKPVGGRWNFDKENRASFDAAGPGKVKPPRAFRPDALTAAVLSMVKRRFSDSPGSLDGFDYPVSRQQARAALRDFIAHRLEKFGTFQDAMASGRPYLYHSRLSCVLNLHLLDPREAIEGALQALREGKAPLNSVEGFVRQILGWREYIRGVYWRQMPGYARLNALDAQLPMPAFMWTGETEMNCVGSCVKQLIDHAYAHHIQRLMVMGLFGLLLGVHPYEVHRWHMSMYADAVDWVSLPNVLGMSQYGDGGIVGTKPYCASGNYINRMSDYCAGCRYDPKKATGPDACPITTLYWDFLARNRARLRANHRMGYQLKNLDNKDRSELRAIRRHAENIKTSLTADTYLSGPIGPLDL
ncbi:MAG: cryptochrome/photolyase family protein [Gemmatimonadota bacterium]|nr:MAG: cryptochrome/photolyase family protein [Gemmatimonadota bacterium]